MPSRSQGLTLVELLVAMGLSLVLLAGVLTIFAGSKATSRLQAGLGTVQENGRYAVQHLLHDVRGAGYIGCASPQAKRVSVLADLDGADVGLSTTDAERLTDNLRNGRLIEGGRVSATDNPFSAVVGTDWIRIWQGEGLGAHLDGAADRDESSIQTSALPVPVKRGDLLLLSDCESMDLFCAGDANSGQRRVDRPDACNDGSRLSKDYAGDAALLAFGGEAYFVREVSSRRNNAGQPIRALFRQDAVTGMARELVDGVEDLQIDYGLDGDGNRSVDRFVASADMRPDDWQRVLSVRLTLTVSSINDVLQQADAAERRIVRPLVATATLRNRVD